MQSEHARGLAGGLLPPGHWRIDSDGQGRPLVLDQAGRTGPDLSISHSGRWVAAAVAEQGRIGIDLETPRHGRDWLSMARAYFSPAEIEVVAAEGESALLAFWTMREAIAKMSGGGVPEALAVDGTALLEARNCTCSTADWVVAHRTQGGIHLAVAWSVPSPDVGPMLSGMLTNALEFALPEKVT